MVVSDNWFDWKNVLKFFLAKNVYFLYYPLIESIIFVCSIYHKYTFCLFSENKTEKVYEN